MDFLAGTLFGVGVTGFVFVVAGSRSIARLDQMVGALDRMMKEGRNHEKYDDSESWKWGGVDDDD
jgi:hypothetical protein